MEKASERKQWHCYMIVIGIFLLLISGSFLSEGIGHDGLENAIVSQKMADGFRDFWLPTLEDNSSTDQMQSYLPLGYWLESRWFKLVGLSFVAEKVYSVLSFVIIGLLIVWIWRLAGNERRTGWMPMLLWIVTPIVSWSATNNLLEGTMTVFILLSVAFLLLAHPTEDAVGLTPRRMLLVFASAIMMELAFLTKGFPGIFPLLFPLIYWFFGRKEKIMYPIADMMGIVSVWGISLLLCIIFLPGTGETLSYYLHHQLIGGVRHVQTVASHFYILYALVVQMALAVVLTIVVVAVRLKHRSFSQHFFYWKHRDELTEDELRHIRCFYRFLFLGLAGVLPIMLGLKQQDFYLIGTLPFFALSLASFMEDLVLDWLNKMNKVAYGILTGLAIVVMGAGVLLNLNSIQKVNTSLDLLTDMKEILPQLQEGETVSVSPELLDAEGGEAEDYFYRYKEVVFDTAMGHEHMLTLYTSVDHMNLDGRYRPVNIQTETYKLYEKEKYIAPQPQEIDTANVVALAY